MKLLEEQITTDWDDTSHWDTWRPELPGKKKQEALNIVLCDAQGRELDVSGLRDLSLEKLLEPEPDYHQSLDLPAEEHPASQSFTIDSSALYKKAILRLDAARHYLGDYLGVQDLTLPTHDPKRGMGGAALG